MKIKAWNIESKNKEFETPIFKVFKNRAQSPESARAGDFFVLHMPDWVNVIALTPDLEIVLVEQYRHGTGKVTLELPAGIIDGNEGPVSAARRELSEETGYASERWSDLGSVCVNPAIQNNRCHIFLAEHCQPAGETNTGYFEEIEIQKVPLEYFIKQIKKGKVDHSLVLAGITRLFLQRPDFF